MEDANAEVERQYAKLLAPKGLRIVKDESKGRCIFATRNVAEGTEVLNDEPYLAALKQVSHLCILFRYSRMRTFS